VFYAFIHWLWGLLDVAAVPQDPTTTQRARFNTRFDDPSAIWERNQLLEIDSIDVQNLSRASRWRVDKDRSNSPYAAIASRIPRNVVEYMCLLLTRYALDFWCPDLDDDPYSAWNTAHRFIAIQAFRQAVAILAFAPTGKVTARANDLWYLTKIYDHFVFSYMRSIYYKERREPGARAQRHLANTARQRVIEVCHSSSVVIVRLVLNRRRQWNKLRVKWFTAAGYPARMIDMVKDPEGASDHEDGERTLTDSNGKEVTERVVYRRKKKGRNPVYDKMLGHADDAIFEEAQVRSKGAKPLRRLMHPDETQMSRPSLPTAGPVDYFAVDFFNNMPITFRARFANSEAVLPETFEELIQEDPIPDFRKYNDARWKRKRGDAIRARYRIPSHEAVGNADDADTEDSDMDVDGRDHGSRRHSTGTKKPTAAGGEQRDDTMTEQQNEFARKMLAITDAPATSSTPGSRQQASFLPPTQQAIAGPSSKHFPSLSRRCYALRSMFTLAPHSRTRHCCRCGDHDAASTERRLSFWAPHDWSVVIPWWSTIGWLASLSEN